MNIISTAEKIETIVLTQSTGTFGTFTEYSPGKFRVVADGLTVLVRCGEHGWHVSFKGMEAIDPELFLAAKYALEEGRGTSLTRHSNLLRDLSAWM